MVVKCKEWFKSNRMKLAIALFISLLVITVFFFQEISVFAREIATESGAGEVLLNQSEHFSLKTLFNDAFRVIAWGIIKGLFHVVYAIETILTNSLSLFGFVEFMQEHSIYTNLLSLLVGTLMAGTLIWIGVKMIINQGQVPQFKTVAQNMFVAIILIIGMPFLMGWLQEGVELVWGKDPEVAQEDNTETNYSNDILTDRVSVQPLRDNIVDLYIPFQQNTNIDDYLNNDDEVKNGITDLDSVRFIQPNEFFKVGELPFDDISDDNKDILESQINIYPNESGDMVEYVEEIEEAGWMAGLMPGNVLETGYYRYSWKFIPIVFTLGALGLAFIYVIFSIVTIYIEMAFKLIASPVVLATDLETGQKTKKVLHDVITGFLTVAFEVVYFRIFVAFYSWLSDQDFGIWLYLFALTAATLALMNGSKTILNWFGVDLGLNEGRSEFSRFAKWSGLKWAGGKALQGAKKGLNKLSGKDGASQGRGQHDQGKAENLNQHGEDNEDVPVPTDDVADEERSSVLKDITRGVGYVSTRGAKGLAKDGAKLGKDALSQGKDLAVEGAKTAGEAVADRTYRPVAETLAGASAGFVAGRMSGSSANEMDETEKSSKEQEETENVDKNRVVRVHDEEQTDGSVDNEAMSESAQQLRRIGTDVDDVNFDEPEAAVRQISEQINEGNLSDEEKQQLVSRIEEASTMKPDEAQQHVRQVLEQAQTETNIDPQNAVRQIREEAEQADFSQPQDTVRQISEQVNDLNLDQDTKQRVSQELEKASAMEPEQAQQHVKQVLEQAQGVPSPETSEALQKVRSEIDSTDFSQPQDAIRQITEQVTAANPNDVSAQRVVQQLEQANSMEPEQAQQHVKQVLENAATVPNTQEAEVIRAVREQVESSDFSQPQSAVRQITEQFTNASNSDSVATQKVVQQIEKASTMQPQEAQQHVRQVLEQAQNVNLGEQTQSVNVKAEPNAPIAAVSQISTATMQPITQSARQIRDVAGDTVGAKTETITQQVMNSAKQPEVVEQTVRRVVQDSGNDIAQPVMQDVAQRVRTVREQANHHNWSDEVVKQRVQKEVQESFSGSNIPETQQQNIVRNITEASVGNTEGTQRVIRQVQNASEATPTQLQRNITRAFTNSFEGANTVIPRTIQQEVQQVIKESPTNAPAKDVVQNVVQRTQKMDFGGNEALREKVINRVKESHIVNEQQLQSNLKQISKNEKGNTRREIDRTK